MDPLEMEENSNSNMYNKINSDCLKLYEYLNEYVMNVSELEDMIIVAMKESQIDTMKILFHSRDCRDEKGNGCRRAFIFAMCFLSEKYPTLFEKNFHLIPNYGRWLDLIEIYANINSTFHKSRIVNFLAETLIEDLDRMNEGDFITYLAKWLPSENKKHDRTSDISEAICKKLYYTENITSYNRREYRKEYLSPLRSYLQICEKYMCQNKWDDIHYSSVPSIAMKNYKYAFKRHSEERFKEWEQKHKKIFVENNPFNPYHGSVSYIMNFKESPFIKMCNKIDDSRYSNVLS
jgi:hypothetical protein